ncbi:MAG: DoxX family protein [Pedobacter sp.]|nr:MAG: DoxX family protein [Pedobacter sp.]
MTIDKSRLPSYLLRIIVIIILLAHSLPGMLDGGVHAFGQYFLDEAGFKPYGVPLACAIKLSHLLCALLILINRWVIPACLLTIVVLMAGIIMVHGKEGWFVVGGGRNGMEFNVLLIFVLSSIALDHGFRCRKEGVARS